MTTDVAIVGGGPAGSTLGTLLKKYAPRLRVSIFGRERFPRDHVGESQLPVVGAVLDEMGVWDAVRATRGGATVQGLFDVLTAQIRENLVAEDDASRFMADAFDAVAAMIADGWLRASYDPSWPALEAPAADATIWTRRPVAP